MRESRLPTETRFRGTFLELKVENAIELLLCNLCSALGVAIERVDVRLIGSVKAAGNQTRKEVWCDFYTLCIY